MPAVPRLWLDPPHAYSVMPFWFWNDDLDESEIVRQIADFQSHGVHGFVIHPRVGLPRTLGWMSDALLHFYDIAIAEAARRRMHVLLYDEGMYPSGSSSGQVVAANPRFQTRCLDRIELSGDALPTLADGHTLVAIARRRNGSRIAVIDRPADSFIRGLHYIGDGPAEDEPPAADILNPDAVDCFLHLVYDRFAERFAAHVGKTITAMFTDEPSLLGRCREKGVWPGTTGILAHVNRILGYDFTPRLPTLWYDDEPDAERARADYARAVKTRLERTYYARLYAWCDAHNLPLTGHPDSGDNIGALRYFHIPGQDLVWRWVLPDHPSALRGAESTQGKCGSSAALHLGRRRNSNECCGAYGHELTWDEMVWLANWCFVRGVNLLYPHAFYYSVRGPRRDERPPDVGPHASWWPRYTHYAAACRRLSFLNTDCTHVCSIAILGRPDWLPWRSAKVCFEHQRDFNYLDERHLWQDALVDDAGVHIAGMHYQALIVEHEPDAQAQLALHTLERAGRLVRVDPAAANDDFLPRLAAIVAPDAPVSPPAPALRLRHIIKDGRHCYMLFNEQEAPLTTHIALPAGSRWAEFDVWTGDVRAVDVAAPLQLAGHDIRVMVGDANT